MIIAVAPPTGSDAESLVAPRVVLLGLLGVTVIRRNRKSEASPDAIAEGEVFCLHGTTRLLKRPSTSSLSIQRWASALRRPSRPTNRKSSKSESNAGKPNKSAPAFQWLIWSHRPFATELPSRRSTRGLRRCAGSEQAARSWSRIIGDCGATFRPSAPRAAISVPPASNGIPEAIALPSLRLHAPRLALALRACLHQPRLAARLVQVNAQQEAVALWKHLEGRGFKPSVRSIGRTLRDQGLRFTEANLRLWLDGFSSRRRRRPTQETSTADANRRNADAASREKDVSLVTKPYSSGSYEPSEPPTLFSGNGATNGKRKRTKPPAEWVEPLHEAVAAIMDRPIDTLSPEERIAFGRECAFRFGHCTASERTNKSHGAQFAKGFGGMAYSDYGELTVRLYLTAGERFDRLNGGAPWFDPWLIKAVIKAPERQAI